MLCVDLQGLHVSFANVLEAQLWVTDASLSKRQFSIKYVFRDSSILHTGTWPSQWSLRCLSRVNMDCSVLGTLSLQGMPKARRKQHKSKEFSLFPAWHRLSMSHSHKSMC